jgi:hypothetical protein
MALCPPLARARMRCRATGSIADVWEAEKAALMQLPTAFDGFVELSKRVSPTCLITFDRNRYSVPASFANRPVSLHIYPDRLVIVAEGHVICSHERVIDRSHQPGRVIYDWRHYLTVVQRKPGALRNGAPFVEMPDAFRKLQAQMLRKPPLTVCMQTVAGNGRGPRPSRACKHTLPGSEWSISCR